MGFDWQLYNKTKPIDHLRLSMVSTMLIQTAKVHSRDLMNITPARLLDTINFEEFDDTKAAKYNWTQVHYGTNDNKDALFANKGDIVVVYRLMQHRKYEPGVMRMQWSATMGFDYHLLSDPSSPGSDYVVLANYFAEGIRKFITANGLKEIVMIDDAPPLPGGDDPSKSMVAQLIKIAEANSATTAYKYLQAAWSAAGQAYHPVTKENIQIPGYPTGVVVRTITPVPLP